MKEFPILPATLVIKCTEALVYFRTTQSGDLSLYKEFNAPDMVAS